MANIFERVRPGDVISSDLFNRIAATLEALDQRISTLEVSGVNPVLITHFEPMVEVEIGQQLTIFGRNFTTPHHNNVVTIDGVRVTEFGIGNTDLRLRGIVPQLGGIIPASGRNVIIRISNDQGVGEMAYRILPEIPVTGNEPTITSVVRVSNNASNLDIGEPARIEGSNFSSTASGNSIRFLIDIGSDTFSTEVTEIRSGDESEIIFIVPEISQVPANFNVPTTLELDVAGRGTVRFSEAVPVGR